MIYPDYKQFLKYAKKGNVIPVFKEINADLDTPVSAFLRIQEDKYSFLLESVEGQEKIARFSFLGTKPHMIFSNRDKEIKIIKPSMGKIKSYVTSKGSLEELEGIMRDFHPVEVNGLPRFYGGFIGYLSYDTVRFIEDIPDKNKDDLNLPDSVFMLTKSLLVFDHLKHKIKIISICYLPRISSAKNNNYVKKLYSQAVEEINHLEMKFKKIMPVSGPLERKPYKITLRSNFTKDGFMNIIKKAKEYIHKGDIIQVVLSQRLKIKINKNSFDIYRKLRSINPSAYMFYLKMDKFSLIGSSPEMLVRCEDGFAQTRPIAGTRPRGRDESQDKKMESELLNDAKERSEHIMLVDLGRNDLGRVCQAGKVKVSEFMTIERYSHVMHIVSEVSGYLKRGKSSFDALKACFPAGTVSGSPKVRAMQIIDELENVRRGPYAGCIGYFSFSGNMDTCITIRTIVLKDGYAYIQAGAGIVADSLPQKEYNESLNKARALVEAINN
ncbi:MAG: anthranilate synthase component I [Candidatus Omnitrophota bacterium]|jgi:anthranilate synthase component 1|nr:MAG: anthranilate synthase component I [Candidatus Omnitrophota bacterium]